MPAAYSSREFGAESNYLMMTKPDDASWPAASSCVQHEAVPCARWFSCCGHISIYHSHTRKQISQLAACMLCMVCTCPYYPPSSFHPRGGLADALILSVLMTWDTDYSRCRELKLFKRWRILFVRTVSTYQSGKLPYDSSYAVMHSRRESVAGTKHNLSTRGFYCQQLSASAIISSHFQCQ